MATWTPTEIVQSVAVFVASGLLEIGGGWCVWRGFREDRRVWLGVVGGALLVGYGFVGLMQPEKEGIEFGRVFAVYGGVFIAMSYGWGVLVDGLVLDTGDVLGGLLALAGASIAWFWPRGTTVAIEQPASPLSGDAATALLIES